MKKTIILAAWALLAPLAAWAQPDVPAAEIFGGYSYFRANPEGFNLNGWNASVTGNLTEWFGIEGDFSGHYGRPTWSGVPIEGVELRSHSVLVGPRVTLRGPGAEPFVHFLIGANVASTEDYGVSRSDSALAALIGAGLDIPVGRNLALRPFQVDYLATRYDVGGYPDERQNNFRFSAGVVFRLGR